MIKTKSRSCNGVNSKKHPQNMRAGYDYNPALQNLPCLILGFTDLTESKTYKLKRFLSQRFQVLVLCL